MRRILIVEHLEQISTLLRESLTAGGCEVEVIADGDTAVARLMGSDFDLVIVNLLLPDDGVLKVVHALHQTDALAPVLIMSKREDIPDDLAGPPKPDNECR